MGTTCCAGRIDAENDERPLKKILPFIVLVLMTCIISKRATGNEEARICLHNWHYMY